jgi:hypothetical protein
VRPVRRPPAARQRLRPGDAGRTAAALELAWTGVDRSEDHLAWARRPGGAGLLARRGGRVGEAGTAGGAGSEYGVTHLALAPSADAADAVLTVLSGLQVLPGL